MGTGEDVAGKSGCMTDPDAGLEIKEEVLKRLRESLETPQEALLSPAQMRRRLKRKAAGGG